MKYDAFISYKHADLDTYVAKSIHKFLETFKIPKAIKKRTGKKKITRVFRDQEELPIGSSLTDNIELALAESEFLIVICTPRTPKSEWVQREISTFIGMHGRERVLAVLAEGEPNEAFPALLLVDENGKKVEPLAADVRGQNQKEVKKKIKMEGVRLAASLLCCDYDDLRQRHRERKVRRMAAVLGGIAVLGIAFGIYSTISASLIRKNFNEKQISQSKYLADMSASLLESGDRKNAALVANEALGSKANDRPYVAAAQYALSNALNCYATGSTPMRDGVLSHESTVNGFEISDDGKNIVSVDNEQRIYFWDADTYECLTMIDKRIDESGNLSRIVKIASTDKGFIIAYNDSISLYDNQGNQLWVYEQMDEMLDFDISNDYSMVAVVCARKCILVDLETGEKTEEYKNKKDDYFLQAFISPNNKYLAVSYVTGKSKSRHVLVYDMKSSKSKKLNVANTYILDCCYVDDNKIAVVSADNVMKYNDKENRIDGGTIELFDINTKKVKWKYSFDYAGMISGTTCLGYSKYTDNIVFASSGNLCVIESSTGHLVNSINYGSNINCFKINQDNEWGYFASESGKIVPFNVSTCELLDYQIADMNDSISQFDYSGGIIVIRGSYGNNLVVMRYSKGPGIKERQNMSESIKDVYVNDDESVYAVETSKDNTYKFSFYNNKDKLIYECEIEDEDADMEISKIFFYKNILVVMRRYGQINFIDPQSRNVNTLSCDNDVYQSVYVSGNKIVYGTYSKYYIIDIDNQQIEYSKELDNSVSDIVYRGRKEELYGVSYQNSLSKINLKTGEEEILDLPDYRTIGNVSDDRIMDIDDEQKYLAVACYDSKLRILTLDNMETICELPFDSSYSCMIKFLPDGENILYKGDNNLYTVYNYKENKYRYIASEEIQEHINKIQISTDKNKIMMYTDLGIYFLDAESYEIVEYAKEGKCYLDNTDKVWSVYAQELYEFPYMDVEMLVKELNKQYKDARLSENDRLKYNID